MSQGGLPNVGSDPIGGAPSAGADPGTSVGGSDQTSAGAGGTPSVGVRFVLISPKDLPALTPAGEHVSSVGWAGASADGSVLAGFKSVDDFPGTPNGLRFFWSAEAGTVTVPSGSPDSGVYVPRILIADGKTLFGGVLTSQEFSDVRQTYWSSFYRWSKESGDVPFGPPEPMYDGYIYHMSADGTTALGNVALGSMRPAEDEEVWRSFRWQQDSGFEYLSSLGGWPAGAEFAALSGDGKVIAGSDADNRPFIWREPNRVVALGDAPPGFLYCFVRRLSNDGSIAFGLCNDSSELNTAFRWTAETGLSSIGVPGYVDATRDGRVIAGTDRLALYRWTAETGAVKLEPPSDWIGTDRYWLDIYEGSLSEDGAAIRGRISTLQAGSNDITARPFRWRQSDGFVGLDPLPGHALSYGFVQARDGSVVAGASSLRSGLDSPAEPVLWDCKGIRDIARELTEAGIDLQGARLSGASYVWVGASIMLAGGASLPGDDRGAWIAWLPNRC